jgi:metal-dependent amidase/aminoacylase/carboxypeptidase family protein
MEIFRWIDSKIHGHPKASYNEYKAHDGITELLDCSTYVDVTRHAYGLENAFMAESGSGGRVVAFNADYDALSGLGHACGRKLISVMSIGPFISVAEALQASGKPGRVRLIGTPSEESLGGKVKLIAAGAYRDVDVCLMWHPGPGIVPEGIAGDAYTYNGQPQVRCPFLQ